MNNSIFDFEPYNGGRGRHECPQCHDRRSFSRYIYTDTHEIIDPTCGICNHANRCGYHLPPREFFRLHPEARRLSWKEQLRRSSPPIVRHQPVAPPNATEPVLPQPIADSILMPEGATMVERYHSPLSTFAQWLLYVVGEEAFMRVYEEYRLGATAEGDVIFWQIDQQQRVRTGKLMRYKSDGHRSTGEHDHPRWMHNFASPPMPDKPTQCLFGEHLLSWRPDAPVALVESEKTALLCAALMPQYVWVASGGCKQLSPQKALALQGRILHVWPDSGVLTHWKSILDPIMQKHYYLHRILEQYPPNTDLADLLVQGN